MNVKQYFKEFYQTTRKPTVKAMEYFMEELGHPEKKVKIIHVAGTNGKGSVTEMLTNILVKNGYRVGKYMSPHLIEYNERISVNHKHIRDEEMIQIIDEIKEKIEHYNQISDEKVTLFELLTIMAFVYFAKQDCDFAVIETGLGGLYDSTNIVEPMVSIITSIGYDHMAILGNTLEEIAIQKAGIIKQNSNTVMMEQKESIQKIVEDTCQEKNNIVTIVQKENIKNKRQEGENSIFDYKGYKDIKLNLKGEKQFENAVLCLETIEIIKKQGYEISNQAIKEGLATVIHRARFETLQENPKIIYDGGHNEEAILNFTNTVNRYYLKEEKIYIVSILKTKDYKAVLKQLLKDKTASFIFTTGNDETRYVSSEELYHTAKQINKQVNADQKSLTDAVSYVKTQKGKIIFIVGSFYIYEDVIKLVKEN